MNLREARARAMDRLARAGIPLPALEADMLVCEAAGLTRTCIHSHPEKSFTVAASAKLDQMLCRREKRESIQYILGVCGFRGEDYEVGPGCLVPRPETELLVKEALDVFETGRFADWGTGSGCLAASLLLERPASTAIALEREPAAIRRAWKNLRSMGLLDRCLLWHCVRAQAPVDEGTLDLVVSNPPYISTHELPGLMPEVSLYEPVRALDGGADGLDAYRILLPWAALVLRQGAFLVAETGGGDQPAEVAALASDSFDHEKTVNDLNGAARVLVLKRK
ncbi:MAG: peptide chain release factor N(5)-glutamine methyltransferase [Synergistota bacterium]|nr:peptide chain release factor N(5)-glutamine methyltransferase [Synergistota bacterium]